MLNFFQQLKCVAFFSLIYFSCSDVKNESSKKKIEFKEKIEDIPEEVSEQTIKKYLIGEWQMDSVMYPPNKESEKNIARAAMLVAEKILNEKATRK